jgi:hypothetical protein
VNLILKYRFALVFLIMISFPPFIVLSQKDLSIPLSLSSTDDDFTIFVPFLKNGDTSPAPEPTPPTRPTPFPVNPSVVDHRSVELFEQIPDEYLQAARELRMVFADRSVGDNINTALNCLTAPSWGESLPSCRRDFYEIDGSTWLWRTFSTIDLQNGQIPEGILFTPNPTKYDRSNWSYDTASDDWEGIIAHFVQNLVPQYINQKDVLSFQFSYLNILPGSTIADPDMGFFVDLPHEGYYSNSLRWDISDLEELESLYPEKMFFYWTTSLARSLGSPEGTAFNNQMRSYAIANDKLLFDVAAILSHDWEGNPCYDNRDGVPYCSQSGDCENYPNDGHNYPAICQEYTTETNGGHLGSVSGGGLRIAKAFWVLMARIAGWEG